MAEALLEKRHLICCAYGLRRAGSRSTAGGTRPGFHDSPTARPFNVSHVVCPSHGDNALHSWAASWLHGRDVILPNLYIRSCLLTVSTNLSGLASAISTMATATNRVLRVALRGDSILTHPRFNKGTGFSASERKAFGLSGRLPYRINTLEEQCRRAYEQLRIREEPLRKNTFLQSLKDQNWVLYYGLLSRHLKELIPIIYTPTQVSLVRRMGAYNQPSHGI